MAGLSKAEAYATIYRAIRDDPFALCRLLKFEPTHQQVRALQDIAAGYPRIAIRSGQGTGKSRLLALIGLWRLLRAQEARVVVTAPSMRQCQDVFMHESRLLMRHAPAFLKDMLHFTSRKVVVGERTRDDDTRPEWGILCVTASDPINAQGYHADSLSFLVDEASGVDRPFIEQIEGTLGQNTGDLLHMQIGNPNTQDSPFYDCFFKNKKYWRTHTFNAEDSPLVSKEHCRYLAEVYGIESDVYRVRVLGLFPAQEPNSVMSLEDVQACSETDPVAMALTQPGRNQFGIDLARFGGDESTVFRRKGGAILEWKAFAKKEPKYVVAYAFGLQVDCGWHDRDAYYVADAGGLGQGVMVEFREAGKRYLEFHTQGTPRNARMFYDKMTEAWFLLRERVRGAAKLPKDKRRCYLPNDPVLHQQLATRIYTLKDGKIKLESKDDYKKRTEQSSPDRADGCVMAFYEPAGESKLALG
jgi:phage terminase large subunit